MIRYEPKCRIKVGAIDAAALGPFTVTDEKKKTPLYFGYGPE